MPDIVQTLIGSTILGGVILGGLWLYLSPKIQSVVEREVSECRRHRTDQINGSLRSIENKIDSAKEEMKGLRADVHYVRDRVDGHINSHNH